MKTPKSLFQKVALTAAFSLPPALANAHPGHDHSSVTGGLLHPVLGMDHLLAMVAVGIWAAQLGGRARWSVPATFIGVMALGGALGANGIALPFVEQGILASVFILGLLIVMAVRMPMVASAAIVATFALFHGAAHGAEMPATASGLGYGIGFMAATAALHLCGVLGGDLLRAAAQKSWVRATGVAVITGGLVLALS
jgi:urease accessory protein